MALTFGDSERIELPSAQTLLNADVFSICFWFRAGSTETNNRLILDEGGSQFDRRLQIMVKASDAGSGPNALQYVYRADNFNVIQSNSAVTDDTWRRALIRRTGTSSDHELFLDTVSQGTVSGTGTNSGESPTIWLGNNTEFTTQSFNENLAHFAAWVGTELTLQQAETFLWTGRWTDRPTYYIPMRSASPRDLSGNGVSLTVSGSPAVADHAPIPAMERLSSGLLVPASSAQSIGAPVAAATAEAPTPAVSAGATSVSVPVAPATAEAPTPAVQQGTTLSPSVAPATAEAPAPSVSPGEASVSAPVAAATAEAPTPSISSGQTISVPNAPATVEAPTPSVSPSVSPAAPVAQASAEASAPQVISPASVSVPVAVVTVSAGTVTVSASLARLLVGQPRITPRLVGSPRLRPRLDGEIGLSPRLSGSPRIEGD